MDRQPLLPVPVSASTATAKPKAHIKLPSVGTAHAQAQERRRPSWAFTLSLSAAALCLLFLSTSTHTNPWTSRSTPSSLPYHIQQAPLAQGNDHDDGHVDRLLQSIMARMRHATHLSTSYCQSSVPSRSTYSPPQSPYPLTLKKVLIFARHGDRSPQNVLRDDVTSNITWTCGSAEYTYIHDATGLSPSRSRHRRRHHNDNQPLVAKRVNHINAKATWHPRMWRGSCAQSELTAKGRQMHLEFGHALRAVYAERLGLVTEAGEVDLSRVRVRATDVGRTLRSAQAVVEGLVPGVTAERVDESTQGTGEQKVQRQRKVNIYTLPTEIDPLHSNKLDQQCPRLARIGSQIKDHPLWNAFLRESLHTRALVAAVAPLKSPHQASDLELNAQDVAGKKGVPSVTENLMCRTCWSKPMPCIPAADARQQIVANVMREEGLARRAAEHVATQVLASMPTITQKDKGQVEQQICLDPATIESLAQFKAFDFYMRNNWFPNRVAPDQIKLEMGPLLREMLDVLATPAADGPKLNLFLTHDGTLSGLLGALRVAPEHHSWPAYRSNVVVEVWEPLTGQPVVRVLRDGEPIRLDPELQPPCELGNGSCPLSAFMEDLIQRSAADWEQACLEE